MNARRLVGLIAGFVVAIAISAPALANLSQGYATTTDIASGSLVSLDSKSSGSVVIADTTNAQRLFGVVVPPSSASISLSGTGSGQVQVVTTGTANVLVATTNGDIKVGDYIAVSPIAGVGAKAGDTTTRVIGTAQADFTGTGDGVTKRTIDDGNGGKKEVAIGQIPIVVTVSAYSQSNGKQSYQLPSWLQNLSNAIAGKTVSPIRIILAAIILLVALVSVTVLLYAAVRNSIISIGRNPLSRSSVLRGLLEVVAIAGGILALAAVAMYLVISR